MVTPGTSRNRRIHPFSITATGQTSVAMISRLTVGSGGGRLGPDFPLLRELEPQLGEQGGVGHAFPPQAGQHSLVLTMFLAQRLKSTQYLHQCRGPVTFWSGSGCGSGS
jgi:hypothetical protein